VMADNPPSADRVSPVVLRLDQRSGVPTYLQLVQQVEQALRLDTSSTATSCRG